MSPIELLRGDKNIIFAVTHMVLHHDFNFTSEQIEQFDQRFKETLGEYMRRLLKSYENEPKNDELGQNGIMGA